MWSVTQIAPNIEVMSSLYANHSNTDLDSDTGAPEGALYDFEFDRYMIEHMSKSSP